MLTALKIGNQVPTLVFDDQDEDPGVEPLLAFSISTQEVMQLVAGLPRLQRLFLPEPGRLEPPGLDMAALRGRFPALELVEGNAW